MWLCDTCGKKNNNTSIKCRHNKCHASKPKKVIDLENKKDESIRDYCPNCKMHRNFRKISGKRYQCPGCKRKALFHGKPVPETPQQILEERLRLAQLNDKSHTEALSQ